MKKIITAINNPKLNEELKKEKNFEIIGKDIQYKEAILEILESNHFIDLIIVSEKIPGQINLEKLIEKIKLINNEIKIIFILEKENEELEKILIKNKILDIYYNNKINLKELIKIINKKEINMEEEIIKLKKIIQEGNKKKGNKINTNIVEKIKKNLKNKKNKKENNRVSKIITFSGNYKSGKTTLSLVIGQYLAEQNYKVLLIDGDIEKQDLSIILNKKQKRKKFIKISKRNKKIKLEKYKYKKLNNRKNIIYYYKIKNKLKMDTKRINKNLYFFNGLKYLIKNKKTKKVVSKFFEIIKFNYNFIILDLSKNNLNILNQEILKNSYLNFLVMEPNILGINEIKKLLSIYLEEWKILKSKLYIIINKKNIISMSRKIITRIIKIQNYNIEIKENKFYLFFLNNYFKRKILLRKKNIKKELNKIVNKINN